MNTQQIIMFVNMLKKYDINLINEMSHDLIGDNVDNVAKKYNITHDKVKCISYLKPEEIKQIYEYTKSNLCTKNANNIILDMKGGVNFKDGVPQVPKKVQDVIRNFNLKNPEETISQASDYFRREIKKKLDKSGSNVSRIVNAIEQKTDEIKKDPKKAISDVQNKVKKTIDSALDNPKSVEIKKILKEITNNELNIIIKNIYGKNIDVAKKTLKNGFTIKLSDENINKIIDILSK